jgi:hypothetical protein
MRPLAIALLGIVLMSCTHATILSGPTERDYSAAAITLPDFSAKIMGSFQSRGLAIPNDFDAQKYFVLLQQIYPDQSRVKSIQDNYRVSVRPLDGGYSVMLCDLKTDRKIMEDMSCHTSRVELRSWESDSIAPCVFEKNWQPYCEQ